tara:strand:+ start:11978 stop:12469 length:492 start_codon:yes stop_codon:yes gene_type:complete
MANLFDINHVLGKIITLVLVIVAANFHILAGVLVLLFIISMNHYVVEGMENNDSSKESQNSSSEKTQEKTQEKPQEESPISLFKTDNCKNGVLMKDGKEVTSDLIKESFPNISFSGDVCNPCDDDCTFEIVSSSEQMTNEENLRPHDSNEHPIDREKAIQKAQ